MKYRVVKDIRTKEGWFEGQYFSDSRFFIPAGTEIELEEIKECGVRDINCGVCWVTNIRRCDGGRGKCEYNCPCHLQVKVQEDTAEELCDKCNKSFRSHSTLHSFSDDIKPPEFICDSEVVDQPKEDILPCKIKKYWKGNHVCNYVDHIECELCKDGESVDQPLTELTPKDVGMGKGEALMSFVRWMNTNFPTFHWDLELSDERFDEYYQKFLSEYKK